MTNHAMRFLVCSDSHGAKERIASLLKRNEGFADGIFFLGDGLSDMLAVYTEYPSFSYFLIHGNCDSSYVCKLTGAQEEQSLTFCQKHILLTHGHLYSVKHGESSLLEHASALRADIVLYGHTHQPCSKRLSFSEQRQLIVGNPGSIGDRFNPSFGVLTLSDSHVFFDLYDWTP